MPRLTEANVLLFGSVLQSTPLTKYDNETRTQTDVPDGVKVLVNSALGEFAQVKLPQKALIEGRVAVPAPGEQIAYVVRYGAYTRGQEGENFVSFQRLVSEGDLDYLASSVNNAVKKAA